LYILINEIINTMKKYFFLLVLLGLATNVSFAQKKEAKQNQEAPTETITKEIDTKVTDGPVMTLDSEVVDYGELMQNGEPLRAVSFTNTGNAPLIIKNARGSCGCTVPAWPKEPVMPGESADIEIRYSTNRVGKINKTVTITTNEVVNNKHVLKVIGLIHKEEEGVPEVKPNILGGGGK
jgi:hypothetical protein